MPTKRAALAFAQRWPRILRLEAAELVEAARTGAGDRPLTLSGPEDIIVRRPMADFAPVLEALHPNDELIPRLEKEIDDSSYWPWLFNLGKRVNGDPWGWISLGRGKRWHLVPYEFTKEKPSIFYSSASFTESMTGACISSSVLLRDSVSLEICRGDDSWDDWVAVRYNVTCPWDAARTHLGRNAMGLGGEGADVECPFCTADPLPGWVTRITTWPPLSQDFVGEALARRHQPCEAHRRCRRIIEIQERRYVWRYGCWVEPHRLVAWRRALRERGRAPAHDPWPFIRVII